MWIDFALMPLNPVATDCCLVRRVLPYGYVLDVRDGRHVELGLYPCLSVAIGVLLLLVELWEAFHHSRQFVSVDVPQVAPKVVGCRAGGACVRQLCECSTLREFSSPRLARACP